MFLLVFDIITRYISHAQCERPSDLLALVFWKVWLSSVSKNNKNGQCCLFNENRKTVPPRPVCLCLKFLILHFHLSAGCLFHSVSRHLKLRIIKAESIYFCYLPSAPRAVSLVAISNHPHPFSPSSSIRFIFSRTLTSGQSLIILFFKAFSSLMLGCFSRGVYLPNPVTLSPASCLSPRSHQLILTKVNTPCYVLLRAFLLGATS